MRRGVGFGTAEELVLPASAIQELSVHGPEWLHIDGENAEVRMTPLSPAPGQGQTVGLVVFDGSGGVRSVHEGTVRALGKGELGRSLDLAFTGFRLAICHADDASIPTEASCAVDLTGLSCPDALQALDIYGQVMEGRAFGLRLNGQELSAGMFPGAPLTRDDHERLARLRLTVEDLPVVLGRCFRPSTCRSPTVSCPSDPSTSTTPASWPRTPNRSCRPWPRAMRRVRR
ncbi:hypothetical protein PL81_39190 [Streptomyces sp. RSD-27]|nr:hypothetical protein PL81_39190 [Streptomyces sp. RSD-27]